MANQSSSTAMIMIKGVLMKGLNESENAIDSNSFVIRFSYFSYVMIM